MPSSTRHSLALLLSCSALTLPACCGEVLDETTPPDETTTAPAAGALLWSRTYGGPFDDRAGSLVLTPDSHAHFLARGGIDGAPDDPRSLLVDVDGDGELVSQPRLGSSSLYPITMGDAALGADGQLVLSGHFDHPTSLSGCALTGPFGHGGEVVAALDENGACLWATTFGELFFSSLDVSAGGEILLAGAGKPGLSLGAGVTLPPSNGPGSQKFYARLSAAGTPLSAHDVGLGVPPLARFDHDGGIVVVSGPTESTLRRFDAQGASTWSHEMADGSIRALTVAGARVVALVTGAEAQSALRSFDAIDGSEAWNLEVSGAVWTTPVALGGGEGDDVVVAGRFAAGETVSLGGEALSGSGQDNLFWALLDGAGGVLRSKVVAVDGAVHPRAAATDGAGDVWVLGELTGSVDFGDGLHTAVPVPPSTPPPAPLGYDIFLARYH